MPLNNCISISWIMLHSLLSVVYSYEIFHNLSFRILQVGQASQSLSLIQGLSRGIELFFSVFLKISTKHSVSQVLSYWKKHQSKCDSRAEMQSSFTKLLLMDQPVEKLKIKYMKLL